VFLARQRASGGGERVLILAIIIEGSELFIELFALGSSAAVSFNIPSISSSFSICPSNLPLPYENVS